MCLKCKWTGPLSTLALHTCELPLTSQSFETSVLDSTDHHMLHSTPVHSNLAERMEMETQTSPIEQEPKTPTFAKDTSIQNTLEIISLTFIKRGTKGPYTLNLT